MARWNETSEGSNLQGNWQALQTVYNQGIPAAISILNQLASRPISG